MKGLKLATNLIFIAFAIIVSPIWIIPVLLVGSGYIVANDGMANTVYNLGQEFPWE